MRPAAVGFAAGSDVQDIGDGDFVLSWLYESDNPILRVNVSEGDYVSVIFVPSSGVRDASVYNARVTDGRTGVTYAKGSDSFVISFTEVVNGQLGFSFSEIGGYLISQGCAAIAVAVNNVFCGRVLAFNSSHTVEDAKAIPLPVLLNGTATQETGAIVTYSSYVNSQESTGQNPFAYFEYPGSNPNNSFKGAHIEIFMFNAETSMLSITTEGGPDVYINKRRYGLVVDVEPDGDVPFALSNSKLFGEDPAWWCQLTEI